MCVLGIVWVLIFGAMLLGAKIHPRVELLVTFLCVGWFAFWTLSMLFNKEKPSTHNVGDHLTGKCDCNEASEESEKSNADTEKETTNK